MVEKVKITYQKVKKKKLKLKVLLKIKIDQKHRLNQNNLPGLLSLIRSMENN